MNRDAILILLCCLAALGVGAFLLLSFGHGAGAPVPSQTSFEEIGRGDHAGDMTERKNYRIRSLEELRALWVIVYGTDGPQVPPVDFSNEEVLAVFDGTHASGGYSVAVDSVVDEPGKRTVTLRRISPGEGCITTQAITSPFSIVRVAKSALPITRNEIEEVVECQ